MLLTRRPAIVPPTVLTLLLLCGFQSIAQGTGSAAVSHLFLTSTPINADVILDGQPLVEQTPLLLKGLAPGEYAVEVRKQGYAPQRLEISLAAGEIRTVTVDLAGQYFSPAFPEEARLLFPDKEQEAGENLFQLPQGTYEVRRRAGGLSIEPVFPQAGWLQGLNLAVPLSLLFCGVLTLHDVFYSPEKRASVQLGSNLYLSPATLSAYGLSLGLIGFDIALHLRKAAFKKSFSYRTLSRQEALHTATEYYELGENLLALGQLEEALRFYARVLEGYRDSPLYPQALFKTARIHYLSGNDSLATVEFDLIAEQYPQPDLYDKAQRSLADIFVRQKEYRAGIERLQRMVFADPLYPPEQIDLLQAEILESWYSEDSAVLPDLVQSYLSMVTAYSESENLDLYRYKAAYYLHIDGRSVEAAELLSRIAVDNLDEELGRKVRELERSLGEGD